MAKERIIAAVVFFLLGVIGACGKISNSGSGTATPTSYASLYEGFYMGDEDNDPVVVISKKATNPITFLDWNQDQAFEGTLSVGKTSKYKSSTFECSYSITGSGSGTGVKLTKKGYVFTKSGWERIDRVQTLKRVDYVVMTAKLAINFFIEDAKTTRQAKANVETIERFTYSATGISIKELRVKDLPSTPTAPPTIGSAPTSPDPLSKPIAPKLDDLKSKLAATFQTWLDKGLVTMDFSTFDAHIADQSKAAYEGANLDAFVADVKRAAYEDLKFKKVVQDQVVTYLADRVIKIAANVTRYSRLQDLKAGPPVVDYFKREYGIDLSKFVVGIGDTAAMASGSNAGGIVAGLFFPPQLGTDQIPAGFTIDTGKLASYKGKYGKIEYQSMVKIPHMNDWLYQEAMKLAFGTEFLVFVEKTLADKDLKNMAPTLAHELRHYLDFKEHPELFALKERLEEKNILIAQSDKEVEPAHTKMVASFEFTDYLDAVVAFFKEKSGAIDVEATKTSVKNDYRDYHYNNYRQYYPYLLSKLETNGFAEEVKYLRKVGKLSKDEMIYEMTIGQSLEFSGKTLDVAEVKGRKVPLVSPRPLYIRKHYSELYDR